MSSTTSYRDWTPPAAAPPAGAIELTCQQLRNLGNAGNVVPGQAYVVTDYNRGTIGAATILTHGVTDRTVSWNVSVQTTFDDSAWHGRWDPDTCRILDLYDNLDNAVRSDTGAELEVFPWGNSAVSGNDFRDFDFNYTAGTVRDNIGGPTARLDVAGTGSVTNSVMTGGSVTRVTDARLYRSNVASGATLTLTGGRVDESTIADNSSVAGDGLNIYTSSFRANSTLLGVGAVGRMDQTSLDRGYLDLRNALGINIDDVTLTAYGRVLASAAASVRLFRTTISASAYIQVTAGNTINATETSVAGSALLRVRNGTLRSDNVTLTSSARLDQNSTGSNTVTSSSATSGGIIEFLNTTTGNTVTGCRAINSGTIRHRGTSAGGLVNRCLANSGYFEIRDSDNVRLYYSSVDSIGYITIRNGSDGFQAQYTTTSAYGRILVDQGSAGRVLGVSVTSLAYVRLRGHASDLRYSEFTSYFYYYLTGNTAPKQGLNGAGRQTYTEPNPGSTVTAIGVRNW